MGVSIWVRPKKELSGVDPLDTDGKLLAKAVDILDRAARKLGVRPLSDFYSVSKKQALAEIEGDDDLTDEEWEALADDHVWWDPADGLASVEALAEWVMQNGDKVHRSDDVLADLEDCRKVLTAAVREGVEFNIGVDA
jgi:hypothetical protein